MNIDDIKKKGELDAVGKEFKSQLFFATRNLELAGSTLLNEKNYTQFRKAADSALEQADDLHSEYTKLTKAIEIQRKP